MKILYGIQGTGHGHLSRAKELLPELGNHADVDVLISGYNCKLTLESPIRYRKHGISMTYDRNGGVSILDTIRSIRPIRFLTDISSIPIDEYDLVISDYEPVTSWAARSANVPGIGLSHQAAFLSEATPRPQSKSSMAEAILRYFAPVDKNIGFHFRRYDTFIEPPIIRSEVRLLAPYRENHITVYLPAYDPDLLVSIFRKLDHVEWHIFSPGTDRFTRLANCRIYPVVNKEFLEILEASAGVITSSGFEMCAEAMYLGKKLLTIPIKNQYEQLCNAAAMQQLGVTVFNSLSPDRADDITTWLETGKEVLLNDIVDVREFVPRMLETVFCKPDLKTPRAGEQSPILLN